MIDPDTGAAKGSKLARFDLIPPRPLYRVAEVYGIGSRKYDDRNWEKGYAWGLSLAALQRHLNLWIQGEKFATDDGQHHLASVIWHALALMEFEETHPEKDDVHVSPPRTPVIGPEEVIPPHAPQPAGWVPGHFVEVMVPEGINAEQVQDALDSALANGAGTI